MYKLKAFLTIATLLLFSSVVFGANYALEITQPQPGLSTNNRYYKAYPGIEYEVPVGVFGGLYPFTFALTTYPTGMTIDADTGIITWPNPTTSGSPHSVTIQVTDDENNTDTVSWTITVTTSGFIFLDASAGDGGDGTISNPLNELEDVWGSDGLTTTYDNYFMYFRGGSYGLTGGWLENCPGQQCNVSWNINSIPHVWIGYPGETAVIDHDLASGSNGMYLRAGGGATDLWASNIRFQDMLNHAVRLSGDSPRSAFYDCTFTNGGPGVDGENSSFIMYTGVATTSTPAYNLVKDNVFSYGNMLAYIKTYSTKKAVIDGNTFSNPTSSSGLAVKAYDEYMAVRGNTFDGNFTYGSFGGNHNYVSHVDMSFNNILNAGDNYPTQLTGAITLNQNSTAGPFYVYRNTFDGTVLLRGGVTGNGPISLTYNVIVNEDSGDGIEIHGDVVDATILSASNNLNGSTADGIIDSNGDLTSPYDNYIGTTGHMLDGSTPVDDTTPDQFTLTDVTGADPLQDYYSGSFTVTGINTSTAISVTDMEYNINSGTYTSTAGTVVNNDVVGYRKAPSSSYNTQVSGVLNIGGVTDTFSISTRTAPGGTLPQVVAPAAFKIFEAGSSLIIQ